MCFQVNNKALCFLIFVPCRCGEVDLPVISASQDQYWPHDQAGSLSLLFCLNVFKCVSLVFKVLFLQSLLIASKELEDLAGNSMNVRAVAAAWVAAFSALDLDKWNRASKTAEDERPLRQGW